jgi:hypothetical protein
MQVDVLDQVCKFKIGQLVTPKVQYALLNALKDNQRPLLFRQKPKCTVLVILDRIIQQCYGGVQVAYACRAHLLHEHALAFHLEQTKFMEPELMEFDPADWREVESVPPKDSDVDTVGDTSQS